MLKTENSSAKQGVKPPASPKGPWKGLGVSNKGVVGNVADVGVGG